MNKTIFRAILVAAVFITIISLLSALVAVNSSFEKTEESRLRADTEMLKNAVEVGGLPYLENLNIPDFRITWISNDGQVLFDDSVDATHLENHSDRDEIKMASLYGYGSSVRYSSTLSTTTIYAANRLSDGSIIRVSMTRASILFELLSLIPSMVIIIIFSAIIAVFVSKKLSSKIIKPLNSLNLDSPLENDTYDEISPLLVKIDAQQKEIKAKMDELEAKKREFEGITDNMSEALILVNSDDVIVSMNNSAMHLFNTDESSNGKDIITLEREITFLDALRRAHDGVNVESIFSKNGFEYSLVISPIKDGEKNLGLCLLFLDITEKARSEELRREFSANVSHELKTPLQTILASSELLCAGVVKSEDQNDFISKIHSEASRLVSLIDDCIRISELDEDVAMNFDNINLPAFFNDVVDALKSSADKKDIKISYYSDDISIRCVPHLFYEIVYNLVDNAIRYNKVGGTIEISFKREKNSLELRVKDSGIGIPKDSLERIFERFYRVDKSHSRASGGTGLGLSIVKHAVLYHGGKLFIESELGKGTNIGADFPLSMATK